MKKHNYWFKRRRYGYGWVPSTWQGWFVLIIYIVTISVVSFLIDYESKEIPKNLIMYLSFVLLSTTVLLLITYKKGPKPKWRNGKTPQDDPEEDF